MIPKVIHYCWFGGNPLPKLAERCIKSWKKYLPDYEIKEWNETNFDVNCCDYVSEAYNSKKWAFVSDYARFWILYNYGGIYFDTDVEVIKNMSNIIAAGAFMGCEMVGSSTIEFDLGINPGLGLGVDPGNELFKEILDLYDGLHFKSGVAHIPTVVDYTTHILKKHGWVGDNEVSKIGGIIIYPPEYFCPYNLSTGKINITDRTVSIHHYAATWFTWLDKVILTIERCDKKKNPIKHKIRRTLSFPFRVINKIKKIGLYEQIYFIKSKLNKIKF